MIPRPTNAWIAKLSRPRHSLHARRSNTFGRRVIGLLEVFSAEPNAFGENDSAVLQRFAEMILAAVVRTARTHDSSTRLPPSPKPFPARRAAFCLFASPQRKRRERGTEKAFGRRRQSRRYSPASRSSLLPDLVAAIIFLVLGYILAPSIQPWIQEKLSSATKRGTNCSGFVASAARRPSLFRPAPGRSRRQPSTNSANFAANGDPAAQYALGLRYASGDGVKQDEKEAASWFIKAAENGNVKAQATLGTRYWGGRGVPASLGQAYFWTVLARAAGDHNSKMFAKSSLPA